jgi:hypothetical protein
MKDRKIKEKIQMDAMPNEILGKILNLTHYEISIFVCRLWHVVLKHVKGICPDSGIYAERLASIGDLHLLRWARESGAYFDSRILLASCHNGNLDIVKWYIELYGYDDKLAKCCAASTRLGNVELMEYLLQQKGVENNIKIQMIIWAIAIGQLDTLKWVLDKLQIKVNFVMIQRALTGIPATKQVPLENLLYLIEDLKISFDKNELCVSASQNNQTDVLRWCLDNCNCSWTIMVEAMAQASEKGHLEPVMMVWDKTKLISHIENFDINNVSDIGLAFSNDNAFYAVRHLPREGYLKWLHWLNEIDIGISPNVAAILARRGDLETLKWIHATDQPNKNWKRQYLWLVDHLGPGPFQWEMAESETMIPPFECESIEDMPYWLMTSHAVAITVSADILFWLDEIGYGPFDNYVCSQVAAAGRFDILQWLHEKNAIIDMNVCGAAANSGNLDMVEWCYDLVSSKNTEHNHLPAAIHQILGEALEAGHLHIAEWITQKGDAEPSHHHVIAAIYSGKMEVLKWLYNYKPFISAIEASETGWDVVTVTVDCNRLDMLEWLTDHEFPLTQTIPKEAAEKGNLSILEWAYNQGCHLTADVMNSAWEGRHEHIIHWLREHNCPESHVIRASLISKKWHARLPRYYYQR